MCVWFRRVGGGRLDGLLTQSPHTPVAGCTTTLSRDGRVRCLVLTNSSHNFVAWITIVDMGDGTGKDDRQEALTVKCHVISVCSCLSAVWVDVCTTEAPVCERGAFKDRFPMTTQLARVALGRLAP